MLDLRGPDDVVAAVAWLSLAVSDPSLDWCEEGQLARVELLADSVYDAWIVRLLHGAIPAGDEQKQTPRDRELESFNPDGPGVATVERTEPRRLYVIASTRMRHRRTPYTPDWRTTYHRPAAMIDLKAIARRALTAVGVDVRRLRRRRRGRASNFAEEQIIASWLARVPPRHRFYVDIAAGDGETMSNTLALATAGWNGLAVEADPAEFARLTGAYARHPHVRLERSVITPDNVIDVLRASGAPRDLGVLSLDIDGYDHFVLARLLEHYRPGLICAEINESIPPPVKFSVTYRPGHRWAKDP